MLISCSTFDPGHPLPSRIMPCARVGSNGIDTSAPAGGCCRPGGGQGTLGSLPAGPRPRRPAFRSLATPLRGRHSGERVPGACHLSVPLSNPAWNPRASATSQSSAALRPSPGHVIALQGRGEPAIAESTLDQPDVVGREQARIGGGAGRYVPWMGKLGRTVLTDRLGHDGGHELLCLRNLVHVYLRRSDPERCFGVGRVVRLLRVCDPSRSNRGQNPYELF